MEIQKEMENVLMDTDLEGKIVALPSASISTQSQTLKAITEVLDNDHSHSFKQQLLELGILYILQPNLHHKKEKIRFPSASIIVSITSGTASQLQLIMEFGIFPTLISFLGLPDLQMQKLALIAMHNTLSNENSLFTEYLMQVNVLPNITFLLQHADNEVVRLALQSLHLILQYHSRIGPEAVHEVKEDVIRCGGRELLDSLKEHPLESVYDLAMTVRLQYFSEGGGEEEMEGQDVI